jgi:hypothetical protein
MDELVYVDLPKGYYEFYPDAKRNAGNGKKLALRAERGIYGTKQAARQWNKDFDAFMKESGCIASKNDACMYYKREGDELMVIVLHVDDGMVCRKYYVCNDKDQARYTMCQGYLQRDLTIFCGKRRHCSVVL